MDDREIRELVDEIGAQAKAVDIALTTIMNDAHKRGMDAGVIASGALFAVVRWHVEHMSAPVTPRHLMTIMLPNIHQIAETLMAAPDETRQ